jgi:hypothetical protein
VKAAPIRFGLTVEAYLLSNAGAAFGDSVLRSNT